MAALARKDYTEAISHLEKAVSLNPSNSQAELKVANVYAELCKPGVQEKSNADLSDLAIRHYRKVIDDNVLPFTAIAAAKGLGNFYLKMGRFDDAKQVYANSKSFNPGDPEPHYWIAVIDWTEASQFRQAEQAKLGMKPNEILAVKNIEICGKVSDANWSNIDDGIHQLETALDLSPELDEAMSYMALLYRERAEVRCNDPSLRAADLKSAGEWTQKAAAVKKLNAARAASPTKE
ncbi:MAG: hypothetical protein ACRD4E_12675 [Bryobacteraceae bacterium]